MEVKIPSNYSQSSLIRVFQSGNPSSGNKKHPFTDPVNERLAVLTKCSITNTFAAWLIVAEFEPKLKVPPSAAYWPIN